MAERVQDLMLLLMWCGGFKPWPRNFLMPREGKKKKKKKKKKNKPKIKDAGGEQETLKKDKGREGFKEKEKVLEDIPIYNLE